MAVSERLMKAGLAYVVTEYRDVADQLLALDTERGMHSEKAKAAMHNASAMAYKWAMLMQLPIGGPDFTEQMVVSAAEYRAEHEADVDEWLEAHRQGQVKITRLGMCPECGHVAAHRLDCSRRFTKQR